MIQRPTPFQIESWAIRVIDQVAAGQPNEDARVELKGQWIDPVQAARLIAGHANAARGEPILWLIGVDQHRGVQGAQHEELANWFPQVKAQFDGVAPELFDLNIPWNGLTVVALLFETDRAPFVVKAQKGVQLEVPWREGTSCRSATRSDLVRLLAPLRRQPNLEVCSSRLTLQNKPYPTGAKDPAYPLTWSFWLTVFIEPVEDRLLTIPEYRCQVWIEVDKVLVRSTPRLLRLVGEPRVEIPTVRRSGEQILVEGPGFFSIQGTWGTSVHALEMGSENKAYITARLGASGVDRPLMVEAVLTYDPSPEYLGRWTFECRPDAYGSLHHD